MLNEEQKIEMAEKLLKDTLFSDKSNSFCMHDSTPDAFECTHKEIHENKLEGNQPFIASMDNKSSFIEKEKQDDEEEKCPSSLSSFPPKLQLSYSNCKFINETECYRTFDAFSNAYNEKHTIRTLNLDSTFYREDPNRASTLFVQEFLRLCMIAPTATFIETFEIYGNQIAYAIKHCETLQQLRDNKTNPIDINLEKLLTEVSSDISFLMSTLKLSNINIELQSINHIASADVFFLSNWGKGKPNVGESNGLVFDVEQVTSLGADEVFSLGMRTLEFHGISKPELKDLKSLSNIIMYNGALDGILSTLKLPFGMELKIKRMLTRDPLERMRLGELVKAQFSSDSRHPPSNSHETRGAGTSIASYKESINAEGHIVVSINAMEEYRGKSLEELRIEDYQSMKYVPESTRAFFISKIRENNSYTDPERKRKCRNLDECRECAAPLEVTAIELPNKNIGDSEAIELSCNTTWKNLKVLNFSQNRIGWGGARALGTNKSWVNLAVLNLSKNKIRDWGVEAISNNKAWTRLTQLDVSDNSIGPEGAAALGANTTWTSLAVLNLSENNIGDQGVVALSKNSSWTWLATLELRNNGISSHGVIALSKNTTWAHIMTLKLSENSKSAEGAVGALKKRWPALFYHHKGDLF